MNRRTHAGRGAAAAIVVVLAGLLLAPALASAAPGDTLAVGWWTRVPTASAPDGGFAVGTAPDGPNSVAAVRLDLGDGVTSLTIQAAEASDGSFIGVQLCPASDAWEAVAGGSLADAPEMDCSSPVAFERNDGVWTADVTSLVRGRQGRVSIGFQAIPGEADPLGVAPTSVSFEAPTVPSVTPVTTTTAAPVTAPPTTAAAAAAPSPQPAPTTPPRRPTPPTTAAPATTTTAPTTTAAPITTAPTLELTSQPITETAAAALIPRDDDAEGRPIGEAFLLVGIAGVVGLGVTGVSRYRETA